MTLEVARIHEKSAANGVPFRFCQLRGTGDSDHASAWTFDDEQELRDRYWHPQPGQVVLDVGAAFGSYALPSLALGARVVCFSPADFDTEVLRLNLAQNPELARRCLVVRDGLHQTNGWFNPNTNLLGGGPGPDNGRPGGEGWLRVCSLDSFLAERPGIDRVDWMKIDVEGAEVGVLRGAEATLRTWRPSILVENHEFQVRGIEHQVRDFLLGLGVGYQMQGPHRHCAVSHSYFQARR